MHEETELSYFPSTNNSSTQRTGSGGTSLLDTSADTTATSQNFARTKDRSGTTAASPSFPAPIVKCNQLPASTSKAISRQPSQWGQSMNQFVLLQWEHRCQCKKGSISTTKGSRAGQDRPKSAAWWRGQCRGTPRATQPTPASGGGRVSPEREIHGFSRQPAPKVSFTVK